MIIRHPAPILATLGFVAITTIAATAAGQEFQCRRDELIRRIELQFANDADRLPCEVVYWKDSEAPGQSQRPWRADHQLDFCTEKAREMVELLEAEGWACDEVAPSAEAAAPARPAAPRLSEPSSLTPPSRDAGATPGTGQPDDATLQAALARDIRRLEELTNGSGKFAPETATLGDLDKDGLEDAAVLLTHRSASGERTHYLMAYLFDGQTFQPVARLKIEGFYQNFSDVGLQAVEDGAVELLLLIPRADDPQCCPSGRRRATFGLQGGQFVLLNESDSGA
jgi:hypothetical protein